MIVRIYSFHRISPVRDALWDPVDPKLFEKIIRYLTKNYKLVNVEDLGNVKGDNLACVVFDDGYKDAMKYAVPILKKYD